MSNYHYIYAEANVKGKWYSLNPVMPLSGGGYGSGAITYFSKSSHPEIIYHLKDHSIYSGLPEDISNSTKEHFRDNLDDSADYWASEMTYRDYYKMTVFVVNFDTAILQKIKKDRPYKYMAYIPRETLAAFECGEFEEIEYWITAQEYKELDPEELRKYVYGRYYIVSDPPFEIMSGRLFRGQHKRVQTILVYDMEHLSTTALSRMTVH